MGHTKNLLKIVWYQKINDKHHKKIKNYHNNKVDDNKIDDNKVDDNKVDDNKVDDNEVDEDKISERKNH